MPTKKRPPTDHTGAKREQLEREHADELQRRQAEMSLAARVAAESDEVVDMTQTVPLEVEDDQDGADLPAVWETVGEPAVRGGSDGTVVIRVNTDLDDVTIGVGNNYSFKEGQACRVPLNVARHLEEKGYIWH